MAWHLSPSLEVLRDEINERWPNRDRRSDGSIGDASHQAGTSDHNPDANESVNAIDVDEDIHHIGASGKSEEIYKIIEAFEKHPAAHYWIYEGQIADKDDGWTRRSYSGSNRHTEHAHFSIRHGNEYENDTRPWGLLEGNVSKEDVKAGIYEFLTEAAARTTPTGRAYGNAVSKLLVYPIVGAVNQTEEDLRVALNDAVAKVVASDENDVVLSDDQVKVLSQQVAQTLAEGSFKFVVDEPPVQ